MFRKSDRFIAHHLQACGIPLIYKALSSLVLVLQLVGCKATYDLSVYEQSLLALGGPDGVNQSAALLDQSIVSAEMVSATIPPGVYADHGILLHLAGNETEAMRQINKESELYPESQAVHRQLAQSYSEHWAATVGRFVLTAPTPLRYSCSLPLTSLATRRQDRLLR